MKKINNILAFLVFGILRLIFREIKKSNNKNILLINTGQIGDLTLSNSMFQNLEQSEFNIYYLINEKYKDLYLDYKGSIKFVTFNLEQYRYSFLYRVLLLKRLRKYQFLKSYNITAERGSVNDEISILSAQERYAFNKNTKFVKRLFINKWNKYYTEVFELITEEVTRYNYVAGKINPRTKSVKGSPKSFVDVRRKYNVLKYINKLVPLGNKRIIVIAPFTNMEIKNWNKYRTLISNLCKSINYLIILIGSSDQREKINKLGQPGNNILNFAGKLTVPESLALVSEADLFIGNDSGFTHVAASLSKKTIAILGGGDIVRFNNYKTMDGIIRLKSDMDCVDCQWHCKFKRPICLEKIEVEDIIESCLKLLKPKEVAV